MKRLILGALGTLALALLAASLTAAGSLSGVPRFLIGAGAIVLLIGVADGFRASSPAPATTASPTPTPPSRPATPTRPLGSSAAAPPAAEGTSAPPLPPSGAIDVRDVIDLTHDDTALVPQTSLIDRFIADGLLRVVNGPVSDDEVHVMVLVAVVEHDTADPRPTALSRRETRTVNA